MNLKNIKYFKILNKFYKIKIKKFILFVILSFLFGIIYHHQQFFPLKHLSNTWHKYLEFFPDLNHRLYSLKLLEINKNYTPRNNRKKVFIIYNYSEGMNIFSDTLYYDRSNTKKDNLILVQIPRHHNKLITLYLPDKTKIIRVLCDRNDNKFYDNWVSEKIDFKIIGKSCIHYLAKTKIFKKGFVSLPPGGPESADPFFIEKKFEKLEIKIISN